MKKKARVKFCWACGKNIMKLFDERIVDGHSRILHLKCARRIDEIEPANSLEPWEEDVDDKNDQNINRYFWFDEEE